MHVLEDQAVLKAKVSPLKEISAAMKIRRHGLVLNPGSLVHPDEEPAAAFNELRSVLRRNEIAIA